MNLAEQVFNAGVVGAGGGGFPTHIKVGSRAEYLIANGAECEPLMHKDAELMAQHAAQIAAGLEAAMAATGASRGIIGLKAKHTEAVEAFEKVLAGRQIQLHILGDFYPTGDEFILVYETTGRLIPPGGIPLEVGAVVQNVETLYNIAAAAQGRPVTHKFLTIAGAVQRPLTCAVPLGLSFRELIDLAGGALVSDYALFVGGTMMGQLTREVDKSVTKTTTGIILLPGDHPLVQRHERPEAAKHRIGKSACDQCTYCTELCPRYLLGYAIEPHKVMRGLVFSMAGKDFWNRWGVLCCECGLCTLYACPEDLYPREACQRAKVELREKGITWTGEKAPKPSVLEPVKLHPMYESRHLPLRHLVQRLGLAPYDRPAPFTQVAVRPAQVRLPLKQHAGAPARPVVQIGSQVQAGEVVAEPPPGQLGARIHASIAGTVQAIEPQILIQAG